jgi:hypothetical protein
LPDDAIGGRAAYLARFAERFAWIHAFDALAVVSKRAGSIDLNVLSSDRSGRRQS